MTTLPPNDAYTAGSQLPRRNRAQRRAALREQRKPTKPRKRQKPRTATVPSLRETATAGQGSISALERDAWVGGISSGPHSRLRRAPTFDVLLFALAAVCLLGSAAVQSTLGDQAMPAYLAELRAVLLAILFGSVLSISTRTILPSAALLVTSLLFAVTGNTYGLFGPSLLMAALSSLAYVVGPLPGANAVSRLAGRFANWRAEKADSRSRLV